MTREEFEKLVGEALDSLPEQFASRMENVVVIVEEWPSPDHLKAGRVGPGMSLFGLYQGVPLPQRRSYTAMLPDRITIFAGPILRATGYEPNLVKEQVKSTVLHEIGHFFGMSEEEIRKAQHKH